MISNVKKPDISPNFTIEDIHKIREWQYELRKEMGQKKYTDYINKRAREFDTMMKARREARKQKANNA